MPTRYEEDDREDSASGEREISLGTGTVLGIFLALALVCSLFFGLGYSMGRKSAPLSPVAAATAPAREPVSSSFTGEEKPSAVSAETPSAGVRPDHQVAQPFSEPAASSSENSSSSNDLPHGRTPAPRSSAATPTVLPVAAVVPATPGVQAYVQVAAVSRKEDADLLLAALKRRGYTGLVRQQPPDTLLHVQVGPFPSKKDAELMRQRLIVDGYNPILK